jgi:asparagine synthase (glutamine-hydrolysing)
MCGICGELSLDLQRAVDERALAVMTDRLRHRGPDHGATWRSPTGRAGLGFRRLSIIDLRPEGHQPMPNEDGTVQLVFNGEIYNYRELRKGLVARGHHFRSNADSEVIVHLYEELGDRLVDEIDGMFALAIWDGRSGRLVLARDRAGKKPLFVYQDAARLVFASEIKALLAHPELAIDIDEDAVPYYFLYGYVPHPQTFYKRVRQIEPGAIEWLSASGKTASRTYWRLTFPSATPGPQDPKTSRPQDLAPPDRAAAARRVRELVTAAVKRRLVSDVPLGAFLSGGLDSTIVVAIMSQLAGEPVRTFSIGFEGDEAFDETAIARETAKRFGARHTEFRVRPSAVDLLDTLVYHHDGPFADSSAIPTYLVSKLTREHVTVALTGDGGDEVFAGYLRFSAALAAERMPAWLGQALGLALAPLPHPRNERHWQARARRFARSCGRPLQDRLAAWTGIFYDDLSTLLHPDFVARLQPIDWRRHLNGLDRLDGLSPLHQMLAANFHSYLHDDLLVKADRMSMANSLEARAPMLDCDLMEFVAGLPDEYTLDGRERKIVLREAFADVVPEAVKRAGKRGFGVPLDAWFRRELAGYMRDHLLSPSARLRTYVSQDYVRRLVDEHAARRANHGHRLWALLTFERWLELVPTWGG